jgi:hypothetical protein
MDINRNDGFHISTDAWSTRSFTGLEALDSVWRGLLKAATVKSGNLNPVQTATTGGIATVEQNSTLAAKPQERETPTGSNGRIIFGLEQFQGNEYTYLGVYLLDLSTLQTRQLFGKGKRFQSASPDGEYIMVSDGSTLYRTDVDGAEPIKLTDSIYSFGNTDAIWLSKGQIAVILIKAGEKRISILSSNGAVESELPVAGASPVEIYPTSNSKLIYWEAGSCSATGMCQRDGAWVTSMDGKINQSLEGIAAPALAPNGNTLASGATSTAAQNNLVLSSPEGKDKRTYPFPGDSLVDYAWSPAADAVAAVVAMRSDYSGKVLGNRNFLIDSSTLTISEYAESNLLNPRVLWSPDGAFIFWMGTLPSENGYMVGGNLVDRISKQVRDMGTAIGLMSPDYLSVTNAAWLPLP